MSTDFRGNQQDLLSTPQGWMRLIPRIAIAFFLIRYVRIYMVHLWQSDIRRLPGPKSTSWIWGIKWDMYVNQNSGYYLDWRKRFGNVYKFRGAFGTTLVGLTDPVGVSHILGTAHVYDYQKPEGGREWFRVLMGKGILWAEGDIHAQKRRKLAPAFTPQAIRDLTPLFHRLAQLLVEEWQSVLDASSTDKTEIDVQYWANRISLDSIGLGGFNYDFDSLSTGKSSDVKTRHPLAQIFDALTDTAGTFSSFLLSALLFKFPVILKLRSERIKKMEEARMSMGSTVTKLWNDAKQEKKLRGSNNGRSILELLVKAQSTSKGNIMSEEEVIDEMNTMIFAGYETTSCVLSWALHELALNQDIQNQLREEVLSLRPNASYDDLTSSKKSKLLDSIVQETIRLHPPVLELHRVALKDDFIPLSAPLNLRAEPQDVLYIPKGTVVAIPINVMQRDTDIWGQDAHSFNPSRWLNQTSDETATRKKLMAFSEGPRTCIGKNFAIIEVKAILVALLRQFTFEPAAEIEEIQSFVMRPKVRGGHGSTLPLKVARVE